MLDKSSIITILEYYDVIIEAGSYIIMGVVIPDELQHKISLLKERKLEVIHE